MDSEGPDSVKVEARPGLLLHAAYFDIDRHSAYLNASNVYVRDGRARYRGVELSATGEVTPQWSMYLTGQFLANKSCPAARNRVDSDHPVHAAGRLAHA